MVTLRSVITRIIQQDDINFVLTNRIPRRLATRVFAWFSQLEQPLVRALSIGVWRLCSDLDLSDAKETRFRSLHDCFVRQLRDGARPADSDPNVLVSPCDAIVGAAGAVVEGEVLQIKGSRYRVRDLLVDNEQAELCSNGCYVTLRLTATMYHHFHAPYDGLIEEASYISGDAWNVNPTALRRVDRLFCKNERGIIKIRLSGSDHRILLVPVAAILVASLRLSFIDPLVDFRRSGPRTIPLDIAVRKCAELGWFQHGSTIIVFAPEGFRLHDAVQEGAVIRVGQPLMWLPSAANGCHLIPS